MKFDLWEGIDNEMGKNEIITTLIIQLLLEDISGREGFSGMSVENFKAMFRDWRDIIYTILEEGVK